MRIGPKRLPSHFYKKIVESMPIACVDIVVTSGKKFFLVKRRDEPAKGEWWPIGGRVIKGESLEAAVTRKVREEMGVRSVRIKKLLTAKGTMFSKSFWGVPTHTVNSVFWVEIGKRLSHIRTDKTVAKSGWFSKINKRWPAYVRAALRLAGFS